MARPGNGHTPLPGQVWAADTGVYGAWGEARYSDEGYLAWLAEQPAEECLFATAPDVVGDARATLARSASMYDRIRSLGYRPALVAQDGLEAEVIPWEDFDALFIGGSTAWKLGPAAELIAREAKARGKWVHMGRVNGRGRLAYAESIGCDSADGTVLKHDPNRDVSGWVDHVNARPSLWGSLHTARRETGIGEPGRKSVIPGRAPAPTT